MLILSFGGPEGPEDVLPFLRNVTAGRAIPDERLASVAEHYQHFGGKSPINDQNRALIAALRAELDTRGAAGGLADLPIYWGNRNWHPMVEATVAEMAADGITEAVVFATAGYSSASSCRQYHEDLARARDAVGPSAPGLRKLAHFFDQPGFVRANSDGLRAALDRLPSGLADRARIVATAHSIPSAMAAAAGPDGGRYEVQLRRTARLIVDQVDPRRPVDLVYQSRSGSPRTPWLEPDVNDHLKALAAQGVPAAVLCPIGFVSDHIEVLWDLDEEAAQTADECGLAMTRAATAGTHPAFVSMIADLIEESFAGGGRRLGSACPPDCCLVDRVLR